MAKIEKSTEKTCSRVSRRRGILAVLLAASTAATVFFAVRTIGDGSSNRGVATRTRQRVSVTADVFAVRDEAIIENSFSSPYSCVPEDGEKVAKGETLAYSFKSPEDAKALSRLKEAKALLKYYETLSNTAVTSTGVSAAVISKLYEELQNFSVMADSGELYRSAGLETDIRKITTTVQLAKGENPELSKSIDKLKKEISSLEAAAFDHAEIKAPNAGYFISGSDGFENVIDYKYCAKMTFEAASKAFSMQKKETDAVGRLVSNPKWYVVSMLPLSGGARFREGSFYSVSFPSVGEKDVRLKCVSIEHNAKKNASMIVFSCDIMNERLASLRKDRAQITSEIIEGLKIDERAIKRDDPKGEYVYVVSAGTLKKRRVKVLYSDSRFAVVRAPEAEESIKTENYIKAFDTYIIGGRKLEEGKRV